MGIFVYFTPAFSLLIIPIVRSYLTAINDRQNREIMTGYVRLYYK
jgi:hypothetical protein